MTADSILVREFGVGGGKRTEIQAKHLKLVTYPAQDVVRRGNRVTLVMEVELPEKMHLYAPGVEGYRPVEVKLTGDPHLKVHETVFPESEVLHLPAIGESVPVYQGKARILQDVTISPRLPGYDKDETTPLVISATFSYQACDDRICYVPAEIPIRFEMALIPHDQDRAPDAIRHNPGS
ncbi:MAG TPA: protein-disulfide reductase DsbD domain-containing protein [Vicinamibacteria bacterium]|nr:protein-disulfide reductase DsbD domain-containing protein [Vicinamibacteria bacterium]